MTIQRRQCPFEQSRNNQDIINLESKLKQLADSIDKFIKFLNQRNLRQFANQLNSLLNYIKQSDITNGFDFANIRQQILSILNSQSINSAINSSTSERLRSDIIDKIEDYIQSLNSQQSAQNTSDTTAQAECYGAVGKIIIGPDPITIPHNSLESDFITLFFEANPDSVELQILSDVVVRVQLKNSSENSIISDFQFSESDISSYGIQKNTNNGSFDFVIPYRLISNSSVQIRFKIVPIPAYRTAINCATINVDAVSSGFGNVYSFFRIKNLTREGQGREGATTPTIRSIASSQTSYNYYDPKFEFISNNTRISETLLPNISAFNTQDATPLSKVLQYKTFGVIDEMILIPTISNGGWRSVTVPVKDYFEEYNIEMSKMLTTSDNNFNSIFQKFLGVINFLYPSDYEKKLLLENEKKKSNFPLYAKIFYDRNGEQPLTFLENNPNLRVDLIGNSLSTQQFNRFAKDFDLLDYFYYALINEVYNKSEEQIDNINIYQPENQQSFLYKYFFNNTTIDMINKPIVYYGEETMISQHNILNDVKQMFFIILQQKPELFINQTLMYEVIKKKSGNPIQKFYFINIFENSFLDFIDTQLKYSVDYTYEIYLYSFNSQIPQNITNNLELANLQQLLVSQQENLNTLKNSIINKLETILDYLSSGTVKANRLRLIIGEGIAGTATFNLEKETTIRTIKQKIQNNSETNSDLQNLNNIITEIKTQINWQYTPISQQYETYIKQAVNTCVEIISDYLNNKQIISNTQQQINNINNSRAAFQVKLNRQLIDQVKVTVLDAFPVIPDVTYSSYIGDDTKILINLNANVGEYEDNFPQVILDEDVREIRNSRAINSNGKVKYKSDDTIRQFEIFRLEEEPETFADFKNGKFMIASTLSNGINYKSTSFVDNVIPNKKYYYTIRSRDVHGAFSNPTNILEIQLINENGTIFLRKKEFIFKTNKNNDIKSVKRFIQIKPVGQQYYVSYPSYSSRNSPNSAYEDLSRIQIGDPELSWIWDKQYVLKLTSKKTGKKIDIKFKFTQSRR